jgi:archaeal type IV pilus assembly protein PilA
MQENSAVSPVIGVLLMLTLTLIIAAIVNSYAGGLAETEPKAPVMTLQASYHSAYSENALEIRHISGDSIPTSSIKAILRPSETFGKEALHQISQIDKKFITNISDTSLSWENGIKVFRPGDIAGISYNNLTQIQNSVDTEYKITNQTISNILGKTFFLEIYYKNSMIARNEVLIEQ